MKRKEKIVLVSLIVALVVIITPAILSMFYIFTIRWPEQHETGRYPGRFVVYSHSSQNYTGEGIFVKGSYDPYWCVGDNGTYVCIGPLGNQRTYDQNGTLITSTTYSYSNATWILKSESGLKVIDWSI